MLAAFAASAASTEDGGEEDAELLANRLQLELGVLRAAHEQNLTLTTEQLRALKAKLLENRAAVLDHLLTIEELMGNLIP